MKKISMIGMSFLGVIAFATVMFFNACSDPCKDVDCQNGGTCSDGTCTCAAGYEGTNCETEIREKFIASWDAVDNCNQSYSYTAEITTSSTDILKVLVNNPFGVGTTVTVTAEINGSTITIPTGSTGNGYTFNGTGTISGDIITWTYHITDSYSNSVDCTGTWNRL